MPVLRNVSLNKSHKKTNSKNYSADTGEEGNKGKVNFCPGSILDSQSLGAGFDARMEVYLSFLSFFTCVSRVITILSPGELRLPNIT